MTTKAVFETATLADSIRKAESIAPDKGGAFDKAAGIVIHVDVENQQVVLRATNLDIYYMEWVDTLEVTGTSTVWRLPSRVLAAFVASLPIGSGKTVEFSQVGNAIKIASGRTTAQLRLINHSAYPFWDMFDSTDMTPVPDLGGRIDQVEWAASKDIPALGIRLTGSRILATNRYRLACSPLEITNLEEPITIPPSTLSTVLKKIGDTRIKIGHNQLYVMPDDHTQITCVMIGESFPPVERIMNRDLPETVTFRKQHLIDMINRTSKIGANRFPVLDLFIGNEEIATMMSEDERGFIGDVIAVTGQAIHPRCIIKFDPDNLIAGLSNSPSEEISLAYNPQDTRKTNIYLYDGSGYEAWIAPRIEPKKGTEVAGS